MKLVRHGSLWVLLLFAHAVKTDELANGLLLQIFFLHFLLFPAETKMMPVHRLIYANSRSLYRYSMKKVQVSEQCRLFAQVVAL